MNKRKLLKQIKRKTPMTKNIHGHLLISNKTTASKTQAILKSGSKGSSNSNLKVDDNISRLLFSSNKGSGRFV